MELFVDLEKYVSVRPLKILFRRRFVDSNSKLSPLSSIKDITVYYEIWIKTYCTFCLFNSIVS